MNGKALFNKIIEELLIVMNDGGTGPAGAGFRCVTGQIYHPLGLGNNVCSFISFWKRLPGFYDILDFEQLKQIIVPESRRYV